MPLPLVTVTASVSFGDGVTPETAILRFTPSAVDASGSDVLLPSYFDAPIVDGAASVDVYPTAAGRGITYLVQVILAVPEGAAYPEKVSHTLASRLQIPDEAGPFTLAELMDLEALPPISETTLAQMTDLRDETVAAAETIGTLAELDAIADAAVAAQDGAETARDEAIAAGAAAGTYATKAEGLAAVSEGGYFWTAEDAPTGYLQLYKDVAGVATEQADIVLPLGGVVDGKADKTSFRTAAAETPSAALPIIAAWAGANGWGGPYMTVGKLASDRYSVGEDGLTTHQFSLGFNLLLTEPAIMDGNGFGVALLGSGDTGGGGTVAVESPIASDGRGLYAFQAMVGRIMAAEAVTVKVMGYGDSWTERDLIPQAIADRLYTAYGQGADGWIGVGANGQHLNAVTTTNSGFTIHDITEEAESGAYSHDGFRADATGTAATYAFNNVRGVDFNLYNLDTDGTFRYRVDGGSWTTVAGGSTNAPAKATISGLTETTHTIEIDTTGNAGTVSILGLYATGIDGAEFQQCGNSAATAADLAAIVGDTAAAFILADLAPHAAYVALGTNDLPANKAPLAFQASQETIVTALLASGDYTGVILASPPRNGRTGWYSMEEYAAAAIETADGNSRVEHLDFTRRFGPYEAMDALGAWSDTAHLNSAGAQIFAAVVFDNFLRHTA